MSVTGDYWVVGLKLDVNTLPSDMTLYKRNVPCFLSGWRWVVLARWTHLVTLIVKALAK